MPIAYNDERLPLLIGEHQQKIFALVVYLIGGDPTKAYEIASTCFAETLRAVSSLERKGETLVKVARAAVAQCRQVQMIPYADDADLAAHPPERRSALRMVKKALFALDFDARAILILRDQLHISHRDIAAVLDIPEAHAKIRAPQARLALRKKLEEVLSRGG
jgi:DNA-directed RNA polymerase specialized sigma24 family protein